MVTSGSTVWLGSRLESRVTDFDGRVRRGRALGRARTEYGDEALLLEVDPLLPDQRRGGAAVLVRRRPDDSWDDLGSRWLEVLVGVIDEATAHRALSSVEPLATGGITHVGQGEAAARPELLPPTQEELWEQSFAALERFVAREGHADVPELHREESLGLGLWVGNQRFRRAQGYLPDEQAARLEALPRWTW